MRPYNSVQMSIRCKVLMCCMHKVENFCKSKIRRSAFSVITVCDQLASHHMMLMILEMIKDSMNFNQNFVYCDFLMSVYPLLSVSNRYYRYMYFYRYQCRCSAKKFSVLLQIRFWQISSDPDEFSVKCLRFFPGHAAIITRCDVCDDRAFTW